METLVHRLRSQRISVTPQRLAIMTVLESRRDHPTAEQIYLQVRRDLPAISFNTVYKTLEVFCQKGLLLKVNPLHEVARYDVQTHHHAHAICRRCYLILDLDWPEDKVPAPPAEITTHFEVENKSLIYWGVCSQCQQTNLNEEED